MQLDITHVCLLLPDCFGGIQGMAGMEGRRGEEITVAEGLLGGLVGEHAHNVVDAVLREHTLLDLFREQCMKRLGAAR